MWGKCLYTQNHLVSLSTASWCIPDEGLYAGSKWEAVLALESVPVTTKPTLSYTLPPNAVSTLLFASCHRWTQALWLTFCLEQSSSLTLLPSTASCCLLSWSMLIILPRDRACCWRDWFPGYLSPSAQCKLVNPIRMIKIIMSQITYSIKCGFVYY